MNISASVELRLDNVIYECGLCQKPRNNATDRVHAISKIHRMKIEGNNAQIELVTVMVCPKCFTEWGFKEPSQIVTPAFIPPKDLRGGRP